MKRTAQASSNPQDAIRMRVDKWLWTARFFKTRSQASAAVASHKVRCNGDRIKPARELRIGDVVEVTTEQASFVVIVRAIAEQRRPAAEARQLYEETPESAALRLNELELRRLAPVPGTELRGRPTKREGRRIRGMTP